MTLSLTTQSNDGLEAYLLAKYEFRKNTVTGKPEERLKDSQLPFRDIHDYTLNSIRRELKANGHKVSKSELNGLINSNFTPRVDVIREYFTGLAGRTSDTDYIALLADTVSTTNQPLWKKCFKKWLVASVACGVNPDIVNHQVLVLVGAQGVGKTTWLHNLLPPALKGYMYSGSINPNNKDTLTTLTENLFINLDELGGFRRNDLNSLKELITKVNIQFRKPYATCTESYTRRASFMGSVNHFNFLSDDTGNRRFLPFTVTAINTKHDIDLNNVYAQAYAIYTSGNFQHWFDIDEIAELQEHMEQYIDTSVEQQLIEKWFDVGEEYDNSIAVTSTEIAQEFKALEGLQINNATVQKIGATLRVLGFKRVKRQGVYKYIVKMKPTETPAINQ